MWNYTGAPLYAAPPGSFLNPAAYAAPLVGQWGNAGRDSITGPAQFGLSASLGRTFPATGQAQSRFAAGCYQCVQSRELHELEYDSE